MDRWFHLLCCTLHLMLFVVCCLLLLLLVIQRPLLLLPLLLRWTAAHSLGLSSLLTSLQLLISALLSDRFVRPILPLSTAA